MIRAVLTALLSSARKPLNGWKTVVGNLDTRLKPGVAERRNPVPGYSFKGKYAGACQWHRIPNASGLNTEN